MSSKPTVLFYFYLTQVKQIPSL